MVGKYMELLDAYKSLIEAMSHAGIQSRTKVNLRYIDLKTSRIRAPAVGRCRRHSRAGRFRSARRRGQDRDGTLCP